MPLVVYDPRAKGNGKVSPRTVELVDLHATLADLCGLPAPKLDGASLKPLLDDPSAKWDRPAYTQVTRGGGAAANAPRRFLGRTVRTERWRYTEWDNGERGVQLYDMEKDPRELHNLAKDPGSAAAVGQMRALLRSAAGTGAQP